MLVKKYDISSEKTEMLTAKELKDIMRCGINRAYDLMKSPAFPSIKIGGRYLVSVFALEKWLELNEGRNFLL